MRLNLEPVYRGNMLRVQDVMILRILQENLGERPVYFALTVPQRNKVNLDDYLQGEGLAEQVMPYEVNQQMAPQTVKENLFEKYQYRNFDNPDVYYNSMTRGLLQNVRSVFSQLAFYFYQEGDHQQMLQVLEKMDTEIPREAVPYRSDDRYLQIGRLYQQGGKLEVLRSRLQSVLGKPGLDVQRKINYGEWYIRYLNDFAAAESLFTDLYNQDPNNGRVVANLIRVYERGQQWQEAYDMLNRWVQNHSNDTQAQQLLERYRQRIQDSADSSNAGE